jgi:hypothetical protein
MSAAKPGACAARACARRLAGVGGLGKFPSRLVGEGGAPAPRSRRSGRRRPGRGRRSSCRRQRGRRAGRDRSRPALDLGGTLDSPAALRWSEGFEADQQRAAGHGRLPSRTAAAKLRLKPTRGREVSDGRTRWCLNFCQEEEAAMRPTVGEILADHVSLEVSCVDRIYVNGYGGGILTSRRGGN